MLSSAWDMTAACVNSQHLWFLHKTCTKSSQSKISTWRMEEIMGPGSSLRSCQQLKAAGKRRLTLLWQCGHWQVSHTPVDDPHSYALIELMNQQSMGRNSTIFLPSSKLQFKSFHYLPLLFIFESCPFLFPKHSLGIVSIKFKAKRINSV